MRKAIFIVAIIICSCSNHSNEQNELIITRIDLEAAGDSVELFAENVISTYMNERDLAISPEGDEIVFTLGNFNSTRRALVHLRKTNEIWSSPNVLPFSGLYQDIEPFFDPDGTRLFFVSNRPIHGDSSRNDYNIWYVERSGSEYGTPKDVGEIINTPSDEFYPSLSEKGNLFFTASYEYGIGNEDIYISKYENDNFTRPEPLDTAINTSTYEFNAFVSPNEDLIIFSSFGRNDDLGGGDLYISNKDEQGNWTESRNLGPEINSNRLDYCPFIDYNSRNFYFTSNRPELVPGRIESIEDLIEEYNAALNGLGNIFRINLTKLESQ